MAEEIDLTPWGYAPGGYIIQCIDCPKDEHWLSLKDTAAKRSWRCKTHALEARYYAQQGTTAIPAPAAGASETTVDGTSKMSIINILGIDPSLTATGWSVIAVDTTTQQIERIVAVGLIETAPSKVKSVRKSSDDLTRARHIIESLRFVIALHNIKMGASEIPSGAQSANAAKAFGIVIGMLASLEIPLIEVTPTEVKLATCGNKIADKEDIVNWALKLTHFEKLDWPSSRVKNDWMIRFDHGFISKKAEHPADACGTVAAALKTQQFRQLCGMLASLIS